MYHFQHNKYLFFLLAIPVLVFLFNALVKWKKRSIKKIGDENLVNALLTGYSPTKFLVKFVLGTLAIAALALSAANLQKPGAMDPVSRKGVDVVIALDVSKSMLAQDNKPNRLEVARQLVYRLIDELQNDRIGLVLFAGRAYLQMPLTSDHAAAKMYVQNAGPEVVPTQGTVIAEALRLANAAFNSKERKYKSVVLISDGEDHDPEALKQALEVASNGVMVNTVGVGSPEGAQIIDPMSNDYKKDAQGQTIISKLNEAELQQIAQSTSGVYVRLIEIEPAVDLIIKKLRSIEQTSLEDSAFKDYRHYFQWFLVAALLLLIVEFFFPERKFKRAVAGPAVVVLMFLVPASCFAQDSKKSIIQGNKFYKEGKFDEAIAAYRKAAEIDPNNEIILYNLANAVFKKENFDEARLTYDRVINLSKVDSFREKNIYNKGVSYTRQKKLLESIQAYKEALKTDPADADARHNLQKALHELRKQNQSGTNNKPNQQKKQQQNQRQQKQQKPQSKFSRRQVEQLMKALRQKEQEIQRKMQQNRSRSSSQPDKDW